MIGGLFFLIVIGLWVASIVYWIVAIVEIAKIPDHQYRAGGTEKTTWILVIVLAGIIGALVWRFGSRRKAVLAAAGYAPPPPPGWYSDSLTGGLRWWDGYNWSAVHTAPPPPSAYRQP